MAEAVKTQEPVGAEISAAAWSHALPFAAWMLLMVVLGSPAAWKYAVRSAVCLALFLGLRPWRWYAGLSVRHLAESFLCGVLVFVLWVGPESAWMNGWPVLKSLYARWAFLPVGKVAAASPYAPETAGWTLAVIRLLGSAVVIAPIEEFFWRGFLYRWLLAKDFLVVSLSTFRPGLFLLVALAFGFEHDRWLAGLVAGLIYGALILRTRDIWAACVAHAITNFLLGLYVLATGAYGFW